MSLDEGAGVGSCGAAGSEPRVDVGLGEFATLGGAERDGVFRGVEGEIRRLMAVRAAMIAVVDDSLSFIDDGHHGPVDWVQAVTNCSRGTAVREVQTAAMLRAFPAVAAAFAGGMVGPDQLRLLTKLFTNPRCRDVLADSEGLLVGHAINLTCREFAQVCARWQAHADPDGALADHDAARDNRTVTYTQTGAGYELRARGDALSGDVFHEILQAHVEAELQTDLALREALHGDQAAKYPLARSASQRRHDALIAIGLKAAGRTDATDREPLVVIHCTAPTLEQAIRDYLGGTGGTGGEPEVSERMRLCETQSGATVSLSDLAVAVLIGQVQRIVTDRAGHTIDLGRRSRLFVGAARDAVLLAGDRCCWPGCEVRTGRIQVDHLTPWAGMLGQTNPLNGAPMCPRHNRHKHNARITVKRDETGWHHYRPDGTEITPRTTP